MLLQHDVSYQNFVRSKGEKIARKAIILKAFIELEVEHSESNDSIIKNHRKSRNI